MNTVDLMDLKWDELAALERAIQVERRARSVRFTAGFRRGLAEVLRRERVRAGLSVKEAAIKAGVRRETVRRAEKEGTSTVFTIVDLLSAYGVNAVHPVLVEAGNAARRAAEPGGREVNP